MSEIGGNFHWPSIPAGHFLTWPKPHTFFSTGRAAAAAIWYQCLPIHTCHRLWLPVYFCPHTAAYWRQSGIDIQCYTDHPALPYPDWATLTPRAGDIVLAVNYFGIRMAEPWQTWHGAHPNVVMIEDHTHDPFSTWAYQSTADFAFASLRKTLPVPDGAILWSPIQHPLPPEPHGRKWNGSALKLVAMLCKMEYINTGERISLLKQVFRQFQIAGEEKLDQSPDQQLAPWSRALLENGFPVVWRYQREDNVQQLLKQLPISDVFCSLFSSWPLGYCPFNVVLIVDTAVRREKMRQHFIAAGIYPPVHWPLPGELDGEEQDISSRVLTIPVDHRCVPSDLERITSVLHDFLNSQ